jgi:phosphocarrier protein HPr
MSSASRQMKIVNQKGLHARAAAKFVKVAGEYASEISVCLGKTEVCGTSIMGLMMLAASRGTVISVTADGYDAETAVEALSELVRNRFDED